MEDNHKPLVNKDATDFAELYALKVLQNKFPYKYVKLRHGDKPDIYDEYQSVGIEVTEAVNPNMAAAMNEWNLSFYEEDKTRQNQRRKRMEKHGEVFQDGPQLWKHLPCTNDDIFRAIQSKSNKFDHYADFHTVDLYIGTFGNHCLTDTEDELADFGNIIIKQIRSINVLFRYIYVETIGYIYRFDIMNDTYMIYTISPEESTRLGNEVRKEIFDMKGA